MRGSESRQSRAEQSKDDVGFRTTLGEKIETTGLAKWLRSWTLPTDLCNFCHHFIYLIDEYGVNGTIFFLSVESGC